MTHKILIVDDEPNILRMLEYALTGAGYEVALAKNGQEALQTLHAGPVDLVILDVMLPDMSGIKICQRLRTIKGLVALPVIMLSARGQVVDKVAGLEAGADEYVTKPVDSDELIARVAALLNRTQRLQQAQARQTGRVIGFIGAKGGVGTTTAALNIAAALTRQGKTVTAVELRSHLGTFSAHLGGSFGGNLADLLTLETAAISEQVLNNHLIEHQGGLRLLFGPQRCEQFKPIEPGYAEAILKNLNTMADYTIVDLPGYPSEASRTALQLCHLTILVVEPEPVCLAAGQSMLELLKSWGIRRHAIRILVNNRNAATVKPDDLKTYFGCDLLGVVPPAKEVYLAAQLKQVPLVFLQPDSLTAIQLSGIAGALHNEKVSLLRRLGQ